MKYWQVVAMTDMEEIPTLALKAEEIGLEVHSLGDPTGDTRCNFVHARPGFRIVDAPGNFCAKQGKRQNDCQQDSVDPHGKACRHTCACG